MWEETCALTNKAICGGDKVVAVSVNPLGLLLDKFSTIDYRQVEHVVRGTYDEYGWVVEGNIRPSTEKFIFMFHASAWDAVLNASIMEQNIKLCEEYFQRKTEKYSGLNQLNETISGQLSDGVLTDEEKKLLQKLLYVKPDKLIIDFMNICSYCFLIRKPLIIPPTGPQFMEDSLPFQEFHQTLRDC